MDKSEQQLKILAELARREKQRKFYKFEPYDWQQDFFSAGKDNPERLLMAANGVGKTLSGAYETACHLTGKYPDWWQGHRFKKPIKMWVGSITDREQKDGTQPALIGENLGEGFEGGFIPPEYFIGKPSPRRASVPDVIDTIYVHHASGGTSSLNFKTYQQGWRLWQAAAPDAVWLDEQPDENSLDEQNIYTEAQTRVFRSGGIIYATLTPLLGETPFIMHFTEPKAKGIYWCGATWDDAPHLDREHKERLMASYPEHVRDARTKGIPMMGEGAVFKVEESEISCAPFEIPKHFARICGIDFGIDHPAAAAWVAYDRGQDIIYVYDCYKKSGETAVYHAAAINARGRDIPVAWPHDGLNREKSGGKNLAQQYRSYGVNMLGKSAHYRPKAGEKPKLGAQDTEPVVYEVLERMKTGRFRVFSNLSDWFSEFRSYHRKDNRIVRVKDDIMSATFYAVMMKRYAMAGTPLKDSPIPQPMIKAL